MESGYTGAGRHERGETMKPDRAGSPGAHRRERERQRCKEEILAAAAEMFSRLSYEKTGMQQIAERVELSVGKIYKHFESKEAIFQELVERNFRIIESGIGDVIERADTPMQKIRRIIGVYAGHFKTHRDFMLIVHNEHPIRMKGIIRGFHLKQKELLAGLFTRAIERGDIKREDPHLLASVLLGSLKGLCGEYMYGKKEGHFDYINEIMDRMILKPLETTREGAS